MMSVMGEDYAARAHPEFVVLNIGEGYGALIIHTTAAWHGTEIEISPDYDDDDRSHKMVLERKAGDRPDYTAVFEHLAEGDYTLWVNDEARARDVAISEGTVVELDWTGEVPPHGGAELGHSHPHGNGHHQH